MLQRLDGMIRHWDHCWGMSECPAEAVHALCRALPFRAW